MRTLQHGLVTVVSCVAAVAMVSVLATSLGDTQPEGAPPTPAAPGTETESNWLVKELNDFADTFGGRD